MRKSTLLLFVVALFGTAFAKEQSPYDRQKPIIAVLPVIDHTDVKNLSWNLSREFTDEIKKRIYDSSKLYLMREGGDLEIAKALNIPDVEDISSEMVNCLKGADFILVTELIEQKQIPYNAAKETKKDTAMVLSLSMRVRVLDLREDTPKVILQEILNHENVVSRAYWNADYERTPWKSEAFFRTPMGLAHAKLTREIVSRVEGYIEAMR